LIAGARVDPKVPIEETIGYIAEYVKAGKLGGISLSEVTADLIRRAAAVHKISAVEVEFSLFCTDILDNGVAKACAELDIPIVAYSPLGRGFLVSTLSVLKQRSLTPSQTGKYKKHSDLEPGSILQHLPRYQPDVFDENIKLVHAVEGIAQKKGVTPAQIALGWVLHQSGKEGLPTIIPIPGATTSARVKENMAPAKLDESDMKELAEILRKFPITGERY